MFVIVPEPIEPDAQDVPVAEDTADFGVAPPPPPTYPTPNGRRAMRGNPLSQRITSQIEGAIMFHTLSFIRDYYFTNRQDAERALERLCITNPNQRYYLMSPMRSAIATATVTFTEE